MFFIHVIPFQTIKQTYVSCYIKLHVIEKYLISLVYALFYIVLDAVSLVYNLKPENELYVGN